MELGLIFYVISGLWGLAVVLNLMIATRICYAIEARSGRQAKGGLPGFANVIPVAFNIGVAQDAETQELRRQMNKRLFIILLGFAVFFFFLYIWGAAP